MSLLCCFLPSMLPIAVIRRHNAQALFKEFAEAQIAAGTPPKGLEQTFAAQVQISPSMWSQVKSSRPIGDQMARQIEALCKKEMGWLDVERASEVSDTAEAHFLDEARKAWRAANAKSKREMLREIRRHLL